MAVDVGVEMEGGVGCRLLREELVTPCMQPAGWQTGGVQARCSTVPVALVAHMTLARMLYLIHLKRKQIFISPEAIFATQL